MNRPLVSILMPAYNAEPFIEDSVRAVLTQEFGDFEFIIVNDGSTDGTRSKILSFIDERIRYIENEVNKGIVFSLNKGLDTAQGRYILRTDADDIALPGMVDKLVEYMEGHPDCIVCGANMKLIGGNRLFTYPSKNEDLKVHTLSYCPFSHSTVIFRLELLRKHNIQYKEEFRDGEDHALWSDLLPYGKFANLKSVTLLYRESTSQITAQKKYAHNYNPVREKIFARHASVFFKLEGKDVNCYTSMIMGKKVDFNELTYIGDLIVKIVKTNKAIAYFDVALLNRFLFIRWHWMCTTAEHSRLEQFLIFYKYALLTNNGIWGILQMLGFLTIKK